MHASLLAVVALIISVVSATTCGDEAVFQSCLGTTQSQLTAYCTDTTDYACLCTRWNAVVTCYNSCPNDPGLAAANSTAITFCADAKVYGTSSSTAYSAPATVTSASSTAGVDGGALTTSGSATGSTAASKTNAAVREAAGGLGMAVFVGAAAVFL